MEEEYEKNRIDFLVSDLCAEIDYWEKQAHTYKQKYEESEKKYNNLIQQDIKHGQEMIGNMVKLFLNPDKVCQNLLGGLGGKEEKQKEEKRVCLRGET